MAIHCFFRQGNKDVARAGNLFNFRNSFSTKSKSCYSLSPAHFINFGNANFFCSNKHIGIYFAIFTAGNCHYDTGHACYFRRASVHNYGRRIRRSTTGHINTNGIYRSNFLTEHRTVRTVGQPSFRHLFFVEFGNISNGAFNCCHHFRFSQSFCFCKFRFGYANIASVQTSFINQIGVVK